MNCLHHRIDNSFLPETSHTRPYDRFISHPSPTPFSTNSHSIYHTISSTSHDMSSAVHNASSALHNASSASHNVSSADHNASSASHNVSSADHNVSSADHNVSSAGHNVSSADHNASSADHNALSAIHNASPAANNDYGTYLIAASTADYTLSFSKNNTKTVNYRPFQRNNVSRPKTYNPTLDHISIYISLKNVFINFNSLYHEKRRYIDKQYGQGCH